MPLEGLNDLYKVLEDLKENADKVAEQAVLAGAENGEVKVWDPMLKEGRYDREGVKGKVRLDGFDAYSDFYNVIRDCETKPYYLFWKE